MSVLFENLEKWDIKADTAFEYAIPTRMFTPFHFQTVLFQTIRHNCARKYDRLKSPHLIFRNIDYDFRNPTLDFLIDNCEGI
jgi:hypothetical protein